MRSKVDGTRNIMLSKKGQVRKEKKNISLVCCEYMYTYMCVCVCGGESLKEEEDHEKGGKDLKWG